jgi:repressor LexA
MTTGERMKQRRKEIGFSAEKVAERLGVSPATIYRYEKGDIEKVPVDSLAELAKILQTTPAYLMGWEEQPSPAASRKPTIPPGFEPMPAMDVVPLVGRIACGTPIMAEENIEQMVCVPSRWHSTFTLTCKGDSMEPRIHDGDLVAIRSQPEVENGEIAAVRIGEEATLKHVYLHENFIELRPENPAFGSIILNREDMNTVVIEGKAVGLCRDI